MANIRKRVAHGSRFFWAIMGNNRWSIKPTLGISKSVGALTLELSTGATLFTDNDDFLGGNRFEQDPLYSSQVHATYSFGRGMWAAASATYDYGGATYVNDAISSERQGNSRAGVTFALPLNRYHSVKMYASRGVSIRTGSDYDLLGLIWQYYWL